MRNVFVETSNVKRFLGAMSALEQRGADEACLMVIDGEPGLGKTTTLMHWVARHGCIYLRAKKEWTARWFMTDLLDALGIVEHPRGFPAQFGKAIDELLKRLARASMERRVFGVVIDEADHISRNGRLLDTIRDATDGIHVPAVLVGMGRINDNLARFPQVASRVSQKVRFEKATFEDVRGLIDARCEVKVADDLVNFVLKVSGGFNREVLEAIANIERFGLRFDAGSAGVTLSDMAGQVITNDRSTCKPIRVPGAV